MNENEVFEEYRNKYYTYFIYAIEKDVIENLAKDIYEYTENSIVLTAALVTALNYRCWDLYREGNEEISKIYADLYYKYNDKAWDWLEKNGTQKEKDWYFHIMD